VVAEQHRLPADWLNDSVKGLLPDRRTPIEGTDTFTTPGLHVGVASAEYLFAMKAMAARQETDGADLRALAATLRIQDAAEGMALVERFYAPVRLTVKTQLLLEDLLTPGA